MHRALPVPDGLEGQRVDQALARLSGCPARWPPTWPTRATSSRRPRRGKGDRLTGGAGWRSSSRPRPGEPAAPRPVEGIDPLRRRRHRRGRQARRRGRPPEPGLGRPDRDRRARRGRLPHLHLGCGRAAGRRPPAGRRHDRSHGGRQERARLHRAQGGLQGAHGRRRATTPSCRAIPTRRGAPSTPPSTGTPGTTGGSPWSAGAGRGDPLPGARGLPGGRLLDIQLETGRTHQIRVHLGALRHPCVGDLTYGADPALSARLGSSASGCTPSGSASRTRAGAAGSTSPARTPPTSRAPSTSSAPRPDQPPPGRDYGLPDSLADLGPAALAAVVVAVYLVPRRAGGRARAAPSLRGAAAQRPGRPPVLLRPAA